MGKGNKYGIDERKRKNTRRKGRGRKERKAKINQTKRENKKKIKVKKKISYNTLANLFFYLNLQLNQPQIDSPRQVTSHLDYTNEARQLSDR